MPICLSIESKDQLQLIPIDKKKIYDWKGDDMHKPKDNDELDVTPIPRKSLSQ